MSSHELYPLTFIVCTVQSVETSVVSVRQDGVGASREVDWLQDELDRLICQNKTSNEDIFSWVKVRSLHFSWMNPSSSVDGFKSAGS
jgi:hypothetical protein